MKLLDRYIARQFLVTFLFAGISFTALFILINLVDNFDEFVDRGISTDRMAVYYLNCLPETFLTTTPLSVLLAAMFVTGKLSMQSELPAMKSAGASLSMLLKPFAIVSLFITGFNIVNACWIVPSTYDRARGFEKFYIKNNGHIEDVGTLHIRESNNRLLTIGRLAPDRNSGTLVSLEQFNGYHIASRTDADSFRYSPSTRQWVFFNTRTRHFTGETENLRINHGADTLKLSFTSESFRMMNAEPDQMNLLQHYQYITQQQHAGLSGLGRAIVKFHTKIAFPFASMIIILIGVPLSTRKKRGGLALEASISLIAGFLYLGMQRTLSTIGYQGVIDPVLAAWLPNILFLCVGLLLCTSANK